MEPVSEQSCPCCGPVVLPLRAAGLGPFGPRNGPPEVFARGPTSAGRRSPNVHVRFAAFIPCQAVEIATAGGIPPEIYRDFTHYRGDDRRVFDFARARENVRISVSALFNMNEGIVTLAGYMNHSHAYVRSQVNPAPVPNTNGLCRTFRPGERDRPRRSARDENHQIRVTAGEDVVVWGHTRRRQFFLSLRATDPIPYGPVPSLEGRVELYLFFDRQTGMPTSYNARGRRKQFPAFELYINANLVHAYDPIRSGRDLWGLARWDAFQTRTAPVPPLPAGVTV